MSANEVIEIEPEQVSGVPAAYNATAILTDPNAFEHQQRVAQMYAAATFMPQHLVGMGGSKALANVFVVMEYAARLGMPVMAVASSSYVVGGKLGFEGKFVAALVNSRAAERPLNYKYSGDGNNLTVTVIGRLKGEDEDRTVTAVLGKVRTKNEMWDKDPEQKLAYVGAIKWARRHCPQVVMGLYTEDDLEVIEEKINQQVLAPAEPARRSRKTSLKDVTATIQPTQAETVDEVTAANLDMLDEVAELLDASAVDVGEALQEIENDEPSDQEIAASIIADLKDRLTKCKLSTDTETALSQAITAANQYGIPGLILPEARELCRLRRLEISGPAMKKVSKSEEKRIKEQQSMLGPSEDDPPF